MKRVFTFWLLLLVGCALDALQAQAPGGVQNGTFRGYRVDYYDGTFTDHTSFGTGTSLSTPVAWGYTGSIVGREFVTQDGDYYGLEYNGIIEVPQTGTYTFQLTNVDDIGYLFINGNLIVSKTCCGASSAVNVSLNAGTATIRVKCAEYGGVEGCGVVWSGPGITGTQELDGRFVYTNASLTAWYKADNASTLTNSTGTYINTWNNLAPDHLYQGNLRLSNAGAWIRVGGIDRLVNYNTAAQFDGDDAYVGNVSTTNRSQNGLVYQNGPLQIFNVSNYYSNISSTHWVMGMGYACGSNEAYGLWRNGTSGINIARPGTVLEAAGSPFVLNDPKIEEAYWNLNTGNGAAQTNIEAIRANGAAAFNTRQVNRNTIFNNVNGIHFGAICGSYTTAAYLPEFIYYPFKLSTEQEKRVNTYLAIKYGVTLSGMDYVSTNGTVIWNNTSNATYNNRVFGIGRELTAEGLNQKQSQSQSKPSGNLSSSYIKVSKGAMAASNAANTGVLSEGAYLLFGDNNGAMTAQGTELPNALSSSCGYQRLAREWKAASIGSPGTVTIVAGSSDAGSFLFNTAMNQIQIMVDEDGNGDFTNGTIRYYTANSVTNGVATFNDVTINNNEVIAFAWRQTAPGGVSNGLAWWLKAGNGTNTTTNSAAVTSWSNLSPEPWEASGNGASQSYISNGTNYNPMVRFAGGGGTASWFAYTNNTQRSWLKGNDPYTFGIASANNLQDGNLIISSDSWGTTCTANAYSGIYANGSGEARIWAGGAGAGGADYGVISAAAFTSNPTAFLATKASGSPATFNHFTDGVLGTTVTSGWTLNNDNRFHFMVRCSGQSHAGDVGDAFVYRRVLTADEQRRVNSYMALKYSTPLANSSGTSASDYISSNGTVIWTGNSTYKYDMFGIGRDDCSGLDQRQSMPKFYNTNNNVKIGLGTINENGNILNTTAFSADQQFLIMGKIGGSADLFSSNTASGIPAAYAATSCNTVRWNQAWKVKNTGNVPGIQMKIGSSAVGLRITESMLNVRLAVDTDGDNNYTTGSTVLYTPASITNGEATFNNVNLPDGATWSLVWTQVAPGGVSQNLQLWLSADKQNTTDVAGTTPATNGQTVAYIGDQVRGLNATQSTAGYRPVLRSTDATKMVNYNPVLEFDGTDDHLSTPYSAELNSNATVFNVGTCTGAAGTYYAPFGNRTPTGGSTRGYNFYWTDGGQFSLWTSNPSTNWDQTSGGAAVYNRPYLLSAVFNTGSGANRTIYGNGIQIGSGTGTYQVNTTKGHFMGTNGDPSYYWRGFLMEQIQYNTSGLTAAQLRRIHTYLAIKYSLPLGNGTGTTSSDYVSSIGTPIWTGNSTYKFDIFGIGRDDCSGLNQKQSISPFYNETSNVKIGLGTINENGNASNTSAFTADQQFLIMGKIGGASDFFTSTSSTGLPAAYAAISNCNAVRWNQAWKVRNTGNVPAVQIKVGSTLNGLNINPSMANLRLVVDVDGDNDFTTGTPVMYSAASISSGEATFNGVLLPDNATWSLIWTNVAPGGVANGLKLWLKANDGLLTTNNSAVSQWENQGADIYNVTQSTSTQRPTFYNTSTDKLINFNPAIYFDGGDELFNSATRLFSNTSPFYIATVALDQRPSGTLATLRGPLGLGTDGNHPAFDLQTDGSSPNGWNPYFGSSSPIEWNGGSAMLFNGNTVGSGQQPQVFGLSTSNGGTDNVRSRVDGFDQMTTLDANNQSQIGNGIWVGSSNDAEWLGAIPEVLVYTANLSTSENQRVLSYLGIKYGITMNATGMSNQYMAGDGTTVIYDYTTHWRNIFGIARDDCSGLLQKQSKSSNSGDHVSVGLNSIVSTNFSNAGNFSTDKMFLLIGNDGASLTGTSIDIPSGYTSPSCNIVRYSREWKVKNVGSVGTIQVKIGSADYRVTKYMLFPALAIDADGDGNFSTGTVTLVNASSVANGVATFDNVVLPNGAVFTMCWTQAAPGGVALSNLKMWYDATDINSVAEGAEATRWEDQSPLGLVSTSTAGASPKYYATTSSKIRNFNPVLEFDGSNDFLGHNLFPNHDYTAGFSTYAMASWNTTGNTYSRIYDYGNGNTNENIILFQQGTSTNFGYQTYFGSSSPGQSVATALVQAGQWQLLNVNINPGAAGTQQTTGIKSNGISFAVPVNAYVPKAINRIYNYIGRSNWSADAYLNGRISEIIQYNELNDAVEQQKVNTYLAIKWGITLDQTTPTNYIASDGTILWNSSTGASYKTDITGIGRDDCGALNQLQSTSTDGNDIISIGRGMLANGNVNNSQAFANDKSFVLIGHNNASMTTFSAGVPSTLNEEGCYLRMNRVWQVQVTGTPGPLSMEFGKSGLLLFNKTFYKPRLIVSSSVSDWSSATVYSPTSISAGIARFDNVTLSNGQYFTIALINAGPGGVVNNLTLWFDASEQVYSDAGSTLATQGTNNVQQWNNLAINANVPSMGHPTLKPDFSESVINFNPAVKYNGADDRTEIGPNALSSWWRENGEYSMYSASQGNTTGVIFAHSTNSSTVGKAEINSNSIVFNNTFYTHGGSTTAPVILNGGYRSGASNGARVFNNGRLQNQATLTNTDAANGWMSIGRAPFIDCCTPNGFVSEFIAFRSDKTFNASENQRINSYLAIKYGITLDQTTATNYLASDGTVIWNATTAGTFKHDITGIGRDDCSALEQKQAASTDANDILTLGIGSITTSNAANISVFTTNKTFIFTAHNNGALNSFEVSSMPSSLAAGGVCYARLGRTWQIQTLGTPGTVSLQVGKSGFFVFNDVYEEPRLLISNSATDWSNATVVTPGSITSGIALFEGIVFSGTQYVAIAVVSAAPGGVRDGLAMWMTADRGTSSTIDNTALTSWADQSANAMDGTGVNGPVFLSGSNTNAVNFNPVIRFNGTSQYFNLPTGFNDFTAGATAFSLLNTNFGTVQTWGRLFHLSTGGNTNALVWNRNSNTNNINQETGNAGGAMTITTATDGALNPTNGPTIHSFQLGTGTSGQTGRNIKFYRNGLNTADLNTAVTPLTTSRNVNRIGYGQGAEYLNGYMGEMVLYNRTLSTSELNKIHTYLAIKYGRTLDASSTWLSSTGTTIFNFSAYNSRVFGIGRDDCSSLHQKQSKSVESGALITIGHGTSIAVDNQSNTNTISTTNTWLVIGDNGRTAAWSPADAPVSGKIRMSRIWRVAETGSLGTVLLQVPASTSSASVKLPSSNGEAVYLLVADAGTSGVFASASGVTEVLMTLNGTNWEASYDFSDGDYFTFATKKFCATCAGISSGLTAWYKLDNLSPGVLDPSSGKLPDLALGNYELTRNSSGTALVMNGSASLSNYNKYIAFSGNAEISRTGLNQEDVLSSTEGTLFSVVSSFPGGNDPASGGIFGVPKSGSSLRTGLSGTANFNGASANYPSSAVPGVPNIIGLRAKVGTGLQALSNGNFGTVTSSLTSRAAGSDYAVQLNTIWWGGWNNSNFSEAIAFNRRLEDAEIQVVNTYLALKFGTTLGHNYFSPEYNGSNAAAATIYDVSTHNNRIFGLGIDSTSCFFQKQSTSMQSGSLLKMTIGSAISSTNELNDGEFTNDLSYVVSGDDNGSIATWSSSELPASLSNACENVQRIPREWKIKALGTLPQVKLIVPDATSAATIKLPTVPDGSSLYLVTNGSTDFGVDSDMEVLEMTFNAANKEWEIDLDLGDGITRYFTFVIKSEVSAYPPALIAQGSTEAIANECQTGDWIYYRGSAATGTENNAIIAVYPNGNTWNPNSISINVNSPASSLATTNGADSIKLMRRLIHVDAPGTFTVNGGVRIRIYYSPTELNNELPSATYNGRRSWFKYSGDVAATLAALRPTDLPAKELIPDSTGVENGISFVEFRNITSFSTFGYVAKTNLAPLPVELSEFKVSKVNKVHTLISWKTLTEKDNAFFEVERSADASNFNTIVSVPGKGTTNSENSYAVTDIQPLKGINFYRLKQVDLDGTTSYSKILSLEFDDVPVANFYPNPAQEFVNVSVNNTQVLNKVYFYDGLGRLVLEQTLNSNATKVDISRLPDGVYTIKCGLFVERLIKQK